MSSIREKILEINRRDDISQQEKSKLIFKVMNPNFNETIEHKEEDIKCEHYKRGCKLECIDCKKFFPCRFCHDEISDHVMNRHKVINVKCNECGNIQEKGESCIKCNKRFARYYCKICTLYDDSENKIITHCDKCGICRVGKNIHCDICDMCFSEEHFDTHPCEGRFDSVCPICNEYLKNSTKNVSILPCKHTIHSECFKNNLMNGNYQCPVCKKTACDTTSLWNQIESYVSNSEMPDEYKDKKNEIYCNDCEQKTVTNFHFFYHKCQNCNSWNTSVVNTL